MKLPIRRFLVNMLMIALPAVFLAACGTVGDTTDMKKANELAITCETDKALKAVDRATAGGGLSSHIADLQRVVSLRDEGRMSEADAAMAERNKRIGADAEAAEEAERAVSKSLEELRTEREKKPAAVPARESGSSISAISQSACRALELQHLTPIYSKIVWFGLTMR